MSFMQTYIDNIYIYTLIIWIFCLHPDPQHKISIWTHENNISSAPTPRCFLSMNPRTPRRKLQTESNRSFHLSQNCFSHKIKVFVGFLSHGLKKTYFHNNSKLQNGSLNGKFVTFLPFMSLLNGQVASTRWSWSNGTATSLLGVIGPEFGDGNFGRGTTKKGKANIRVSYFCSCIVFPRCFGKVSLNSTANKMS